MKNEHRLNDKYCRMSMIFESRATSSRESRIRDSRQLDTLFGCAICGLAMFTSDVFFMQTNKIHVRLQGQAKVQNTRSLNLEFRTSLKNCIKSLDTRELAFSVFLVLRTPEPVFRKWESCCRASE